jgi:hypothetical protein
MVGVPGRREGCAGNPLAQSSTPALSLRGGNCNLLRHERSLAGECRGCHRTVKERPSHEAMACCDQPSMGSAGARLECLDRDYRTTCLAPAISRSERTGRTTISGRTRCLPVHRRRGFGRRRRCARTFPGQFMPHSNRATSRSLIDSLWLWLAVRAGLARESRLSCHLTVSSATPISWAKRTSSPASTVA